MSDTLTAREWHEFLAFTEQQATLEAAYAAASVGSTRLIREAQVKQKLARLLKDAELKAFSTPSEMGYCTAMEEAVRTMAQVYVGKPGWKREWTI